MPRAFLVKNKQETCNRSAVTLHDGDEDEDENHVGMLKDVKNSRDQRYAVFDVIWQVMNGRSVEEERREGRDVRQHIEQLMKITDRNRDLGHSVNDADINSIRRLMMPLLPFGTESLHSQNRLLFDRIHEVQPLINEHLKWTDYNCSPSRDTHPLFDRDWLLPSPRDPVACRQYQPLMPIAWTVDRSRHQQLQQSPLPGRSPPEKVDSSLPPAHFPILPPASSSSSSSPLPSALITSHQSIASNDAAAAVTSSMSNPFANCKPLTADVDTNRLYPRINPPTSKSPNASNSNSSSLQRSVPTFKSSSSTSPCLSTAVKCSGVSRSLFSPYNNSLLTSSQAVDYFADLIAGQYRCLPFVRTRHQQIADDPLSVAAAAAAAGIGNDVRLLADQVNAVAGGDGLRKSGAVPCYSRDTASGSTASVTVTGSMRPIGNRATPIGRYRCPDCPKSYSTVGGLSKHRQFYCRRQTNGSSSTTTTSRQASSHSGVSAAVSATSVRDQRCPQCDKSYTSTSALKMHIRTHTLPCRCRLCGKAFSRPWLLQGHLRTHTGEKPFECPHCSRAFADRSNLRAHLQTHYDVKQYNCTVCRRTFSRMSLLLKHRYGPCSAAAIAASNSSVTVTATVSTGSGLNVRGQVL